MTRTNRNGTDDSQSDEIIDAEADRVRREFETPVSDYVTGDEGNVLLAEEGAGAAWIEADPAMVFEASDMR